MCVEVFFTRNFKRFVENSLFYTYSYSLIVKQQNKKEDMLTQNVQLKSPTVRHKMSSTSLKHVPPVDAPYMKACKVSILCFSVILDHDRLQSSWDVTESCCYGLVLAEIEGEHRWSFPPSADQCENFLLVSHFAFTSQCSVRIKTPTTQNSD